MKQAIELKKLRLKTGMTQKELATAIGLRTGQAIHNAEKGICPVPYHYLTYFINAGLDVKKLKLAIISDFKEKLERAIVRGRD